MYVKFVEEIIDHYRKAREPVRKHVKISRGESRAISAEVEDLLAYYIINAFKKIDHIYINQTLTSVKNGKNQRLKPDTDNVS